MHIPDGLMDPAVLAAGWLLALAAVALAIRGIGEDDERRSIPLMGVIAGAIFVGQMINFPIGGGTTGHLVGAALAVALLGRDRAIIVLTAIVGVQCFMFGDGGLTALGLNILNMAVIAVLVSWAVMKAFAGLSPKFALLAAAWLSVFVAAGACALQLAVSHDISGGDFGIAGGVAVPTMLLFHAFIGVGEAVITLGVVSYVERVAPEMFGKDALMRPARTEQDMGVRA